MIYNKNDLKELQSKPMGTPLKNVVMFINGFLEGMHDSEHCVPDHRKFSGHNNLDMSIDNNFYLLFPGHQMHKKVTRGLWSCHLVFKQNAYVDSSGRLYYLDVYAVHPKELLCSYK